MKPHDCGNGRPHVLVLGGTAEGRRLAARLAARGLRVSYALAGVTARPRIPEGVAVVSGGFGGAAGLAEWLRRHGVTALVDATHPFAARMQAQAAMAARQAKVAGYRLARRPWRPQPGDRWLKAEDLAAAACRLPRQARVLAAVGSRGLSAFLAREDLWLTARVMMPPTFPLPPRWRLLRGGPAATVAQEAALLRTVRAQWLVCRNSGGKAGRPRLVAARLLGLPVVMVEPPVPPAGLEVHYDAATLAAALAARLDPPDGPTPGQSKGRSEVAGKSLIRPHRP